MENLQQITNEILQYGKGILAADESAKSNAKRFAKHSINDTKENRRLWRQLLFTQNNIEKYISAVILFDETLRQVDDTGKLFPKLLSNKGIVPGIKVDLGTEALENCPNEMATKGLDGLTERLEEYSNMGAKFTKWRAIFSVSDSTPTDKAIYVNAHCLALYAAKAQQLGMVPIVEPELLMDTDHNIDLAYDLTSTILNAVFTELNNLDVDLSGIILKPNMVVSGAKCEEQATASEVAVLSVDCYLRNVPAIVPGIAFLSGGQSDIQATENLKAIVSHARKVNAPWDITFSYGRALQNKALECWSGKPENWKEAQNIFNQRCIQLSLAVKDK